MSVERVCASNFSQRILGAELILVLLQPRGLMLLWGRLGLRLICVLLRAVKDNSLVGVALALGDLAVALGSSFGPMLRLPITSLCPSLRLFWPM